MLTKRSQTFYKPMNVHSVTYAIGERVSSTSLWSILNQSGKYDFSCGQRVDNFGGRKLFTDEMNRYCLNLILGRRDRSCCTKENPRCINSSINETFWLRNVEEQERFCKQSIAKLNEKHIIHLMFSCKCWTSRKFVRSELTVLNLALSKHGRSATRMRGGRPLLSFSENQKKCLNFGK